MKPSINNLLIVEDNSIIRNNIFNAVKDISDIEKIHQKKSLQETFSILEETSFKLIILDLKLPDGNGLELLKMLKEKQVATKVFVFSISTELKYLCLKYGAFAFYDKAKDFDKLIEAIKNIYKRW